MEGVSIMTSFLYIWFASDVPQLFLFNSIKKIYKKSCKIIFSKYTSFISSHLAVKLQDIAHSTAIAHVCIYMCVFKWSCITHGDNDPPKDYTLI